jgi:hypothetical protein
MWEILLNRRRLEEDLQETCSAYRLPESDLELARRIVDESPTSANPPWLEETLLAHDARLQALGMTIKEWRRLPARDKHLLLGTPSRLGAASATASSRRSTVEDDPEPVLGARPSRKDITLHDAWWIRKLDRERPNWVEEIEKHIVTLAQLADLLAPHARMEKGRPRNEKTIRRRLVEKLKKLSHERRNEARCRKSPRR